MIGFGQQTYVPDDNFEAYLEANGMGNGIANDDYVTTANIDTLTYLNINSKSIADLTGIESFAALTFLDCSDNSINSTTLDVSNNTALTYLDCSDNSINLTILDVSNNTALIELRCRYNQIDSLDLSNNPTLTYLTCRNNDLTSLNLSGATSLEFLDCSENNLTSLDLSPNTYLNTLQCGGNDLTSLDLRNGNNTNFLYFSAVYNPWLSCINVDDSTWASNNLAIDMISGSNAIDSQHYFSDNCSGTTAIQEHSTNKELLKVKDILGRETKQTNQPLFYIYDDGTVEKRIVIE